MPGKETCGPEGDRWYFERIEQKVSEDVADYYASTNAIAVEILTGDKGLKSYQPHSPAPKPRRRR
ncbi:hypothetical protein [Endozoicomonas sp. 8E]|uniref:hypothetical protein n=1 Tax=Endozoicomonas sp. 8E TaxID=3035692 RepID=UPI0029390613|nr:hypothetical protein [Endozoicomonas sp. 8E]WOG27953.1 hypothetical protein P6910_25995 [Endozoicomonas sp. 8E]